MALNQAQKKKHKALLRMHLDVLMFMTTMFGMATVFAYAKLSQSIFVDGNTTIDGAANLCTENITGNFSINGSWGDGHGGTTYGTSLSVSNNGDTDITWRGEIKAGSDLTVKYGETTYANSNGIAEIVPYSWAERISPGRSIDSYMELNVIDTPIKVKYIKINNCIIYEDESGGGDTPVTPEPLTSVILRPDSAEMIVGESMTLNAVKRPSDAVATFSWSSSNPLVATVNSNGVVHAVSAGTTTITVTSDNGKTATSTITVNRPMDISSAHVTWNLTSHWANFLQFRIRVENTSLSELKKVTFRIAVPEGSTYTLWSQNISNSGNVVTVKNIPASGYSEFYGQIEMPSQYNSNNYLSPTIVVESVS